MTKTLLLARAAVLRAFATFDPQDAVLTRAAYATAGVAAVPAQDAGAHARSRT